MSNWVRAVTPLEILSSSIPPWTLLCMHKDIFHRLFTAARFPHYLKTQHDPTTSQITKWAWKILRRNSSSFSFNRDYLDLLVHTYRGPAFEHTRVHVNATWHIDSGKRKADHVFPRGWLSCSSRLRLRHRDPSVLFSAVPPGFAPTSIPASSMLPCACISRTVTYICS